MKKSNSINSRKEYSHNYYLKNKEKIYKYNKNWRKNNKNKLKKYYLKYGRERYKKNPGLILSYNKKWKERNPEKYKIIQVKYEREYRKKYPEKVRARNIANRELKHLKKKGYEFHHKDYSKPLDIDILPLKKHKEIHKNIRGFI